MSKNPFQQASPLLVLFVLISAIGLAAKNWLEIKGISREVLLTGNLVLFLASLAAFYITYRSLRSANPQVFVRSMYGSFMIKFFLIVVTAFVYIMTTKKNVNKPALVICAGLYIIYTVIETRILTRLLKQKKDAEKGSPR